MDGDVCITIQCLLSLSKLTCDLISEILGDNSHPHIEDSPGYEAKQALSKE